ncbi:MAG: hypothetical protein IT388_10045, partial [Nitrospirales bacterium]|nr:hypothetical protein [Nitrospirales bacterium]
MILRIDALYLLLLAELSLFLLGAAVFLFFRGGRYKRLYHKALGEIEALGEGPKAASLPPEVAESPPEKGEVRTLQEAQETAALPHQEELTEAGEDNSLSGLRREIGTLQRI